MMLPIQLNDMPRGSGKSTKARDSLIRSKRTAVMLVPNQMQKRYHIKNNPSIIDDIFTFEEFLKDEKLLGRDRFSKVILDEGLNQLDITMLPLMYKLGRMNLTVEIYGTTTDMMGEENKIWEWSPYDNKAR